MTHSRAISRYRYLTSRQFYRHAEVEELADVLPSPASDSELDAVAGCGMLAKMFEALSPDQRETLRLYFFEGYTLPEIAVERGKILGTVKNHFYRGLDRLRRQIFEAKALPKWKPPTEDAAEPTVAITQASPVTEISPDEVGVLKVCFKCRQEKPLSDFYRHSQTLDGHLGKCKECVKAYGREYRLLGVPVPMSEKQMKLFGKKPEEHEEFLNLCALSTTGELTDTERLMLQEHLSECHECREAMKQFNVVVDHAIPTIGAEIRA